MVLEQPSQRLPSVFDGAVPQQSSRPPLLIEIDQAAANVAACRLKDEIDREVHVISQMLLAENFADRDAAERLRGLARLQDRPRA